MKPGRVLLAISMVGVMAACGSQSPGLPTHSSSTVASRPSSPARISILAPQNGQVVYGNTLAVRLALKNARIVRPTTSKIDPRKGHIHVLLDGSLVSMNYGLKDTISKLTPGTHTLRVEFVASDHLPFDPRVFQEVAFEVKA